MPRAPCRPCPARRPVFVIQAVQAQQTAESLAAAISEAEASGDSLRVVEVLAEAKVLGVALPAVALESSVRVYARGGQWQRAQDLLSQVKALGHQPSSETVQAVFAALAAAKQGDRALGLLNELSQSWEPSLLGPAYNNVTRTLARQGEVQKAYDLLVVMVKKQDIRIDADTFVAIANEYIKLGQQDLAEEVLEMRDYL